MENRCAVIAVAFALVGLAPATASAQFGNYYNGPGGGLTDTGIPVQTTNTFVLVQNNPFCASNSPNCVAFIPLSTFASAASQSQTMAQIESINNQISALNSQIAKSLEIGAIAAAMKDAIPNSGDRFAIRLNAAAFNGQSAGAIGFSYNLNDMARVAVNYGQGRSQSIVSGGVNLSFR